MTRGGAAMRCSAGELDSNAARQRYPDVTPAATSRQSRSASNEIRTRIKYRPPARQHRCEYQAPLGAGELCGRDHAILALVLGAVEGRVGSLQEVVPRLLRA